MQHPVPFHASLAEQRRECVVFFFFSHLYVEQVERHGHLQREAPEGVETGTKVDDAVQVGGHQVHQSSRAEPRNVGRTLKKNEFPNDLFANQTFKPNQIQ